MSTKLVILGLLKKKPLYGYEIKQIIESRMGDWTSIAFGSIYFALNKLSEDNLIQKIVEEQEGNRPSRSIYKITEAGEREFVSLLKDVWKTDEQIFFPLDIALFFIRALPRAEVIKLLKIRVKGIEMGLHHLTEHKNETLSIKKIPKIGKAIFEHSEAHLGAEFKWLKGLIKGLESGEY
jgi:DNA-binding PadR family transcriptional regulator